MKKILCLAIATLFAVGLLTCTTFATDIPASEIVETQVEEAVVQNDFVTWFKNDILPKIISLLTVSGVGLVYLIPVLYKVIKASRRFDTSSDAVEGFILTAHDREDAWEKEKAEFIENLNNAFEDLEKKEEQSEEILKKRIEALEELAKGFVDALHESEEHLSKVLDHVEIMSDKTERMVYLGLTNNPALVGNGTARKVAEVEEEE
jgi:flagellar hook-basal body complex protein FliE